MRVLLLLVLLLTIVADDVADAYCYNPQTPINAILEDDDDDDDDEHHPHHHHPHHECQHENSTQDTQEGGLLQTHCQKHCGNHYQHGLYWVSISARNFLHPRFVQLQIFPEDDNILKQDFIDSPFRPPRVEAA